MLFSTEHLNKPWKPISLYLLLCIRKNPYHFSFSSASEETHFIIPSAILIPEVFTMATLKIHPNKKKNIEILGKVVYGTYHNMKKAEVNTEYRLPYSEQEILPPQPTTGVCVWCSACLCAIIIILAILAGLIVLIVFLLFHPKIPRFDIMTGRINRINLDPNTYLMNADIVLLVNIINTNHKVDLKYEYINFKLYFRNDLVGYQQLEPFEQMRHNWNYSVLDIISNDVELKPLNAQVLVNMAVQNKIAYKLLGTFRTTAKFGGIAKVPYWVYAECQLTFTAPPNGTLSDHTCTTRR
ncbi:hypothetical protein SUGI_0521590 [Cryptomeria japonica]|uniref:NDR1/HIN1-like protein 13 n=1 Tax=Cryptomeria japonica TaxID=3369 RepID=UPI002408E883|nr:NDR1/HIN1-like protein 13 [Cryptomeria japonica]GLJ26762.1 hypothetical protein SUGI_0521590 [Cryptomeria japonica]